MRLAHGFTISIAVSLLCCVSYSAWAYKLNPCLRVLTYEKYLLGQEAIRKGNLCDNAPQKYEVGAVHEHMTNFAIEEYRGTGFIASEAQNPGKVQRRNYMEPADWRKATETGKRNTYALIYGTWWNDDPLMYTWGSSIDFNFGLAGLKSQFANKKATYRGGVAKCKVAGEDYLGRASHFGKMQYLHFMTDLKVTKDVSEADRLDDTITKSLLWIEFAYGVAINDRKPDSTLTAKDTETLQLPSIAKNYCLQDANNAKVRTLFARAGENTSERDEITPDVALGSIFHLIQDSFSPGHTCRSEMRVSGQYVAALRKAYNYNEQDAKKEHSPRDGYPGWLLTYGVAGKHVYANDPVAVGAWLLDAVESGKPWDQVRAHLLETVFIKQPDNAPEQPCIGIRNS